MTRSAAPCLRPAMLAALAAVLALLRVGPARAEASADELPIMDRHKPIVCLEDGDGQLWRVQCIDDDDGKRCLYAPDAQLDASGKIMPGVSLERVAACPLEGRFDQTALKRDGWTLIHATADVPLGWTRDERGRVFQVNFDLHNRLYLGVNWQPTRLTDRDFDLSSMGIDFGVLELEIMNGGRGRDATRHRLAILRGDVQVAPFAADFTLLHYDLSRRRQHPLFRLTTFVGKPRRYDIDAHLGGWFELGRVTFRDDEEGRRTGLVRFATAHLTWDILRSDDMYSYFRVRGGAGIERSFVEDLFVDAHDAITPGAAVDGNITFDHAGYNHLTFTASWERPIGLRDREAGEDRVLGDRVHLAAGYERILFGINDQPFSLRAAVEADYRTDLIDPTAPRGWDVRGILGLRFNLWVPGR